MGVSFVAQTNTTDSNVDSAVINKPTGTVDGDLMLLFCVGQAPSGNASGVAPPAGWLDANYGQDDGTASDPYYRVWYKIASGEGASYTISTAFYHDFYGFMARTYRGQDVLPIDVPSTPSGTPFQNNTASTNITAPSVSPVKLNGMVVALFYQTGTTGTITPPSGFGNSSGTISITNQINFLSCDKLITATGATGTFVATSTVSAINLGGLIVVKPLVPLRTTPGRMQALSRSTY